MRVEVVATPRLSLCGATLDDFEALYGRVLSDPEVMRHVFTGHALSLESARAFFDKDFDSEATGQKLGVLIERSAGEVIGFAGLTPTSALGEADFELGFVLARQAWHRGYAQEIGRAQLTFGFTVLKCHRVLALSSPNNPRSISALKKIGMQYHSTNDYQDRGNRAIYVKYSSCQD